MSFYYYIIAKALKKSALEKGFVVTSDKQKGRPHLIYI